MSITSTISASATWRRGGSCLCAKTGTPIMLSMNCRCGTSTVFCTVWSVGTCYYTTTGMSTNLSKNSNCAISTGFWAPVVAQQRACQQLVQDLQLKYPRASARSGPWPPVVEQQRMSKNCTCGISTGFSTVRTMETYRCKTTGKSTTLTNLQKRNLHGLLHDPNNGHLS